MTPSLNATTPLVAEGTRRASAGAAIGQAIGGACDADDALLERNHPAGR